MYDPLRAKAKVVFYSAVAFLFGIGIASGLGWTSATQAAPVVDETPRVSEDAVRPALELSDAFVSISQAVTPAVVRIEARKTMTSAHQRVPDAFRRFFREDPQGDDEPRMELAGGSGFITTKDGYILTNDHVVSGSNKITVYLHDRRSFDAHLVGTDPFTDVAVIKIDVGEELPTLPFGDSEGVRVGEWVLAVGNPGFGSGSQLDYTVTAGIVSARGRGLGLLQRELQREYGRDPQTQDQNIPGYSIEDFIQTDAVINPGNSGGPLVDLQGRVVGMNSAIASNTGYYQGYGFAIPVNLAHRVMEDLVAYGHVKRPLLGVSMQEVAPEDAEYYHLPAVTGVLVQSVSPGSPAAKAGLRPEDVIVAVDGEQVGYSAQLQQRVAEHHPGDQVTVSFYRNGKEQQVSARLDEAQALNNLPTHVAEVSRVSEERLGIKVEALDEDTAGQLGFDTAEGVIISDVQPGSPADRRNIVPGYRIDEINGTKVTTPKDVRSILDAVQGGDVVSLQLADPTGQTRIVNLRMPG